MGMKLVERMRVKSKRFVALHLRYETDMLTFSGCYYGGGEKEIEESLASKEELAEFSSNSLRLTALDFIVCDESDVFVSNNMARMLAGRRRYFGDKPTIHQNARKLYKLFVNRDRIECKEFVLKFQIGLMGEATEVKAGRGGFYEYPLSCICRKSKP